MIEEVPADQAPEWFKKAVGERPPWMVPGQLSVTLLEPKSVDAIAVVGESFYQEALWYIVRKQFARGDRVHHDCVALILAEDDNPNDKNAISVWIDALKVGYFNRQDALDFRASLLSARARHGHEIGLRASIIGGGIRDGQSHNLGVWMYYDPEEMPRP
ncbi:MAG: hypothetical protein ABI586_07485 [Candidatus Nanopelagicales bacterium]